MDQIDRVLRKYAAEGDDTKDKLYGASFVLTDRNGTGYPPLLHHYCILEE